MAQKSGVNYETLETIIVCCRVAEEFGGRPDTTGLPQADADRIQKDFQDAVFNDVFGPTAPVVAALSSPEEPAAMAAVTRAKPQRLAKMKQTYCQLAEAFNAVHSAASAAATASMQGPKAEQVKRMPSAPVPAA